MVADKIKDFGEYIPGARKEYYINSGITLADLDDIPASEYLQLITRDMIWPEDNYQELVDRKGYSPLAAYFIRTLRRIIPPKPNFGAYSEPKKVAERYVVFIRYVSDLCKRIVHDDDIAPVSAELTLAIRYHEVHWRDPDTDVEISKTTPSEVSYTHLRQIEDLVSRPAALKFECALQRFPYHFRGELKGARLRRRGDGYHIYSSTGKVLSEKAFPSESAILEYAASGSLDAELDAKKQTKRVSTVTKVVRPQLDHIERVGPNLRYGRNARPEHLLKQFNLRGGQFGNWNSQDDRQAYLNYAYDGLVDLAAVLDVPTSFFAFAREGGERMGLAFGARGHAGAAAHYEPELHVINLTKMNGAGSMAHEFGHGMDYWLAYVLRDYLVMSHAQRTRHTGAAELIKTHNICVSDDADPKLIPVVEAMKTIVSHIQTTEVDVTKDKLLQIAATRVSESTGMLVAIRASMKNVLESAFIRPLKSRAELAPEGYEVIKDALGYCERHNVNLMHIRNRFTGDGETIEPETIADFHLDELEGYDFIVGMCTPEKAKDFAATWSSKAEPVMAEIYDLHREVRAETFQPSMDTVKQFVRLYDTAMGLLESAVKFERENCLMDTAPITQCDRHLETAKEHVSRYTWRPEDMRAAIEFEASADPTKLYPVNAINPNEPTKRKSSYQHEAEELDKNRSKGYYATIVEMFARAFEHYIEKKITSIGAKSQYLVHSANSASYAIFGQHPYPEGEESRVLCQDYERLMQSIVDAGLTGCEVFERSELYTSKSNWVSYVQNIRTVNKKVADKVAAEAPKTLAETSTPQSSKPEFSKPGVSAPDTRVAAMAKAKSGLQLQLAALAGKPYKYDNPLQVVDNLAVRARNLGGVRCGYVQKVPEAWKKATHSGILRVGPNQQGEMLVQIETGDSPKKTLEAMLEGNVIAAMRLAGVTKMTPAMHLAVYVLCRRYGLDVRTYNITEYSEATAAVPGATERLLYEVSNILKTEYIKKVLW